MIKTEKPGKFFVFLIISKFHCWTIIKFRTKDQKGFTYHLSKVICHVPHCHDPSTSVPGPLVPWANAVVRDHPSGSCQNARHQVEKGHNNPQYQAGQRRQIVCETEDPSEDYWNVEVAVEVDRNTCRQKVSTALHIRLLGNIDATSHTRDHFFCAFSTWSCFFFLEPKWWDARRHRCTASKWMLIMNLKISQDVMLRKLIVIIKCSCGDRTRLSVTLDWSSSVWNFLPYPHQRDYSLLVSLSLIICVCGGTLILIKIQ